mmetsp:Transcript_93994/g.251649  ORF Transcript_93994/g.251649 Transcript_93994/m.251649 type:complete len:253 (+) Transcript_93994:43-801(+)
MAPSRGPAGRQRDEEDKRFRHTTYAQQVVQRLTKALTQPEKGHLLENELLDCQRLFLEHDYTMNGLISRGEFTDLLRSIGLEKSMGGTFMAFAGIAFDATSADAALLSFRDFMQIYCQIRDRSPDLLPLYYRSQRKVHKKFTLQEWLLGEVSEKFAVKCSELGCTVEPKRIPMIELMVMVRDLGLPDRDSDQLYTFTAKLIDLTGLDKNADLNCDDFQRCVRLMLMEAARLLGPKCPHQLAKYVAQASALER